MIDNKPYGLSRLVGIHVGQKQGNVDLVIVFPLIGICIPCNNHREILDKTVGQPPFIVFKKNDAFYKGKPIGLIFVFQNLLYQSQKPYPLRLKIGIYALGSIVMQYL